MMSEPWHVRVQSYVDQLQQVAETINAILEQTQVDSAAVNAAEVQRSTEQFEHALIELAEKIARREELLQASDAPRKGGTLTEKLQSTLRLEDAKLARRCEQVAALIASTNQRAVSLFICQYHLSEFSSDIVRLLSGTSLTSTYDASARSVTDGSGGLFNESA